ncbi:MAG: hypothetical protein PCFJNLEI_00550 [Verrucomicrobiae bacterium]|nr:hypothetical protein [Verrucomicrobiae bacterium]
MSFYSNNKSRRGATRFLGTARWLGVAGALLLFPVLAPSTSAQVTSSVANLSGDPLYWTNSAIWWSSAPDGAYPGANSSTPDDWVVLTNDTASYTVILNSGLADPIGRLNINFLSTISSLGQLTTVIITNGVSSPTILTNTGLRLGTGARLQIDNGGVVTGITTLVLSGNQPTIYLNEGGKLFWSNPTGNLTLGNNFSNMNATITTISQTGGVWNHGGRGFYVGYTAATGNVLTVSGSVTLTNVGTTVNMQVGGGGASWNSLILSNGAKLFGGDVYIALGSGSNNTYRIGGLGAESTAANGAIYISQNGARDNSIILTNARWTTVGAVNIGENVASNNNISVYANATWNPSAGNISIGSGTGFSNTLTVTGGTVTNAGAINVGTAGAKSSVLTIQDGGKFFSRAVTVGGTSSSASNQYNVGGFGLSSTVTNWGIIVGANVSGGYNQLNITNALLLTPASIIGSGSSTNAAVVSSGGLWNLSGGELIIGSNAIHNSVTVNTGGVVTNANITVGKTGPGGPAATANNQLIVNGGAVWASALRVTNAANVVAFNSGTIGVTSATYSNGLAFVVGNGVNNATLQLGSGVHSFEKGINLLTNSYLKGNGATLDATITNTLIGGNIAIGADGGNTFTINGVMTGSANQLTKQDAGTVILAGNNDFSAPVVVSAGTLTIANSTSTGLGAAAPVTVSGGNFVLNNAGGTGVAGNIGVNSGTLFVNNTGASAGAGAASTVTVGGGFVTGNGTISGSMVLNTGTLTAGNNSLATLTLGSLTVNGGYLPFEFLNTGLDNDKLSVTTPGGLTINGGTVLLYTNNSTVRFDTVGLYYLIQHDGAIGGAGETAFTVGNQANTRTYNFGVSAGYVTLAIGGTGQGWNPGSNSTDTYWMNSTNWGGGSGPAPVAYDQLLFDGNAKPINTNNFISNTKFAGIMFTNSAGTFVLNGMAAGTNTVNLVGDVINRSANTQTINLPLVLDSGSRAFNTLNGNMIANGVISGSDSTVGLVKRGSRVLELTGANTYSGVTEIVSGVLRATDGGGLPAASNLKLNGGVLETSGTFSRSLGTSAGSLQWTGSGGFSARGGTLSVNLGGAGAGVTWGSGNFVPTSSALILGATTSDSTVKFINPIDLGSAQRTVQVDNGSAFVDAELAGILSGSSGGLTKTGPGVLRLSADYTSSGALTVSGGGLIANASISAGSDLSLATGTTLYGTGTIARVISGSGTVAPGLNPGILTVDQLNPSGGLDFTFEFTQLGSPDYTQAGASGNDVLRITNSLPFTVALGITNTVNLKVSAALVVGQTNVFRGGFYTDNSALFDDKLSNATFSVSGPGAGALVYWKTVNEAAFSQNGYVLEFGVLGQTVVSVVPEPNVFVLWLAGALTFWAARRRRARK